MILFLMILYLPSMQDMPVNWSKMPRQEGKYTHIVAVGGDGTVNEVGGALCGSDVAFGVVSLGSGNGFARHLGYSVFMTKALKQVLTDQFAQIDVLEMNGKYSLNVSGVGIRCRGGP